MTDETEPVLGVVLAHGEMARGLVDAVSRIAGTDPDALVAVSNQGRSQEQIEAELDELMGQRPSVVFTDLQTGSCALIARLVCRERGTRAAVFGVNLAILLDFVFHRELSLEEVVPRLVRKGRESVRAIPEEQSHADTSVSG